jgi:hypothetical protein
VDLEDSEASGGREALEVDIRVMFLVLFFLVLVIAPFFIISFAL